MSISPIYLEVVAPPPPGPAWSLEACHPLSPSLLLYPPVQSHGNLAPSGGSLGSWGVLGDPGQGAQGGRPDGAGGDEAAVLAHHLAQHVLGLLATRGPAQVCHPCLGAGLH